jgi:integrase
MANLTKRVIDAATPGPVEYELYDGEIPGLALRVYPNSRKTYALYYRNSDGRKRRLTLGVHGSLAPDQARRLAKEKLAEVTRGGDPAAIRLLLLTGCRKGEILGLRWENVDFDRACLRLSDSKTGAKTVALGAPALRLLAAADPSCAWVCPGGREHL